MQHQVARSEPGLRRQPKGAESTTPPAASSSIGDEAADYRYSFRWKYPTGVSACPANSVLVTFTLSADAPAGRLEKLLAPKQA